MPSFTKRKPKVHVETTNSDHATAHGGQILIDSLCRRFDLWQKIHQEPLFDPRKRKTIGFSPAAIIAQFLFTFTSGGVSLADAERLADDSVLMLMLGLEKGADESTLGEWLRAQTSQSVEALHRINAELVDWASKATVSGRWRHAGQTEIFFDDTQIEVTGRHFEGTRINYEGNRAFSWQTLWLGPWLLDAILDGSGDVSQHLPELLATHRHRWEGKPSYFYADSASSAGKFLDRIEQAGFSRWSVSYNKWTDKLDRLASELPSNQWSPEVDGPFGKREFAWVRHQPGECTRAQTFAVTRWKNEGDLMWRYGYRVCRQGEKDSPQAVFDRHDLKGACEKGFSDLLSGLDLHHPPCMELIANQMFYAIATLAHNILISFKLLEVPAESQTWRVTTLIRHLTVPAVLSTHSRYTIARICIPAKWMRWFRLFIDQWLPKRKPGHPRVEAVDSA